MEINTIKKILDDESFRTINSKLVYLIVESGSIINNKYVEKISSLYDKAVQMGASVLYFIYNVGIDITDNCSLSYYGKILIKQNIASSVILQIALITGSWVVV